MNKCRDRAPPLPKNNLGNWFGSFLFGKRQEFLLRLGADSNSINSTTKRRLYSRIYKPSELHLEIIQFRSKPINELIYISKVLERDNKDYIIVMMVRSPLNTILSGYNYHAQGI